MKIKLDIPGSMDDVSLRDYKHFLKIHEKNDDPKFIRAKMLEIFCKVSL